MNPIPEDIQEAPREAKPVSWRQAGAVIMKPVTREEYHMTMDYLSRRWGIGFLCEPELLRDLCGPIGRVITTNSAREGEGGV